MQLPPATAAAIERLGADLAVARLRRKESLRTWAARMGVSVPTLQRLEAGDPGVGVGIVATALSGADPTIMLTGPMPATRKALAKAGLTIDDIDLFEVNEAFAAVPMRFMAEMHVPHEKVNVNGGAIALGHPLGATGAMLIGTLLDELERRQLQRGLVTLCVGGGMGIATIIERV